MKDFLKWNKFLLENFNSTNPSQKVPVSLFVSYFILTVDKQRIDGGVVSNLIRKIPNVTTVSKDTIGVEETHFYKALYSIKFVLESYEDLNTYLVKVLKKNLQNIKGITVNSYRGVENLDKK